MSTQSPWEVREDAFPTLGRLHEQMEFLVRFAILSPSARNMQPWRFGIDETVIRLYPDEGRLTPVADPDRRELHLSLGCALECLLVAALHFGFGVDVQYGPTEGHPLQVAAVTLAPNTAQATSRVPGLFDALKTRHTHHHNFLPEQVPQSEIDRIIDSCKEEGVTLFLTSDPAVRVAASELVVRADALWFADPAYREELATCIGAGNFGTGWLLSSIGELAMAFLNMGNAVSRQNHDLVQHAPVLGAVCTEHNDRASQLKAGQVLARIMLTATVHGLNVHPMSQMVGHPEIRAEFAKHLPDPLLFPQQPFRLGYASTELRHTPRRPLEEALLG